MEQFNAMNTITQVLVASPSTQSSSADPAAEIDGEPVREILSIGLEFDQARVFWGDCVIDPGISRAEPHLRLTPASARDTIDEQIRPALMGRPLSSFREVSEQIDGLTETITHTVVRPPDDQEANQPNRYSRRAFFTAQLNPATRRQVTEQVTVFRSVHPRIRYAVSQALLAGAAAARNLTPAELIAREYDIAVDPAPVPLQVQLDGDWPIQFHASGTAFAAAGYRFPGQDPEAEFGASGGGLKRLADRLAQAMPGEVEPGDRPAIHLDVNGGLGQLYDDNVGRILGVLFGLKEIASANVLRIADPLIMDALEPQVERMHRLKEYLRFRKLSLSLVAGAWVDTPEAVSAFAEADAAHMIHVDMARTGSLHQAILVIQACRRHGLDVILGGGPAETDHSTRLACHVAMACRPQLFATPVSLGVAGAEIVASEMARTAARLLAIGADPDDGEPPAAGAHNDS